MKIKNKTQLVVAWTTNLMFAISIFGLFDLVADLRQGVSGIHLAIEISILLFSFGSIIWLAITWMRMRSEAMSASACLDQHLRRVTERLQAQFSAWSLTKAESYVALLLIKGLSHQEIADSSGRSERTTRQQAITVYKKSRLKGRAELAAYFIDDLLAHAEVSAETTTHLGAGRRPVVRTRTAHLVSRRHDQASRSPVSAFANEASMPRSS